MVTKNRTKTKLVCKGFIDESPETQNALLDKMGRKRNKERTQMTKEQLLSLWNADNLGGNELWGVLYGSPGR